MSSPTHSAKASATKNARACWWGEGMSSFGDALMAFGAPLAIYKDTGDPLFSALPVGLIALGNVLGSYTIRRANFAISDRAGCVRVDLAAAVVALAPLLSTLGARTLILLLTTFLVAYLQTIRSGFDESLVGQLAKAEGQSREFFIGRTKLFVNLGSLLGFALAAPIAATVGALAIFALNALSFAACAAIVATISAPIQHARKSRPASAVSILFGPRLRWLSLSHATAAVCLWVVNSTAFYTLIDHFRASTGILSVYFCAQMLGAIAGSALIVASTRRNAIDERWAPLFRLGYAVAVAAMALASNVATFIAAVAFLSVVHAFSLPIWQSMFQRSSSESDWRVVGASRKSLVSLVGAATSLVAGGLYRSWPAEALYAAAAVFAVLSAAILLWHLSADRSLRAEAAVGTE